MTVQDILVRRNLNNICHLIYELDDGSRIIDTEAYLNHIEGEYCYCFRNQKQFRFKIANLIQIT